MIQKGKNQIISFTFFIMVLFSVLFSVQQIDIEAHIVTAEAAESTCDWNATLTMSGSDGTGFKLEFGESVNASNGFDELDMPIPPSPPVIPHINARFLTSFDPPYAELYKEVKVFPDTNKTWNFSVIWFAGPGNTSTVVITIQWEISDLDQSEYDTILLLKNNTIVKDMLNSETYSYDTVSNEPSFFSIVCSEGNITNNINNNHTQTDASDTPFLSLTSIILILFFVIIFYRKSFNKK